MLEKFRFLAKPSFRRKECAVDAPNCQGCSALFTFFRRKHHCRRCEGIFCSACTQQRIVLRGHGRVPVRICCPCKELEGASRPYTRSRHKSRVAKGPSSAGAKSKDELEEKAIDNVLSEVIGRPSTCTASTSKTLGTDDIPNRENDIHESGSTTTPIHGVHGFLSDSPEELHKKAKEEMENYRILEQQGKSKEALLALKRKREVERQALQLERALQKTIKRSPVTSSSVSGETNDQPLAATRKSKNSDLTSDLKELGWCDAYTKEANENQTAMTLEGEFMSILGDAPLNSHPAKQTNVDKSQVMVHRKNALQLKREGRIAEAKEELKKAKILEKELEERELLANGEQSDDEIAALMHIMGADNEETSMLGDIGFNINELTGVGEDTDSDRIEVKDDDTNDPYIAAALKSFGYEEETGKEDLPVVPSVSQEAKRDEVLFLKKEALRLKREGNILEAMEQLKKAKLLEKELENSMSGGSLNTQNDDGSLKLSGHNYEKRVDTESSINANCTGFNQPSESRAEIPKELLGVKRKALALRREGQLAEAGKELKNGEELEILLRELENAPGRETTEEEVDEVTEQDMNDPSLLLMLKGLGWEDEDNQRVKDEAQSHPVQDSIELKHKMTNIQISPAYHLSQAPLPSYLPDRMMGEGPKQNYFATGASGSTGTIRNSSAQCAKTDIEPKVLSSRRPIAVAKEQEKPSTTLPEISYNETMKEILAHKRRAVALKKEGKLAEAKDEMRRAKVLERSLEASKEENAGNAPTYVSEPEQKLQKVQTTYGNQTVTLPLHSVCTKTSKCIESRQQEQDREPISARERFKKQQQALAHKRQSLQLRKQGRMEEAEKELELARALESQIEELNGGEKQIQMPLSSEDGDFLDPQLLSALQSLGMHGTPAPAQHKQGRKVSTRTK